MGQGGSANQGPYGQQRGHSGQVPIPAAFENAQPYLGPPKPQINMSTTYGGPPGYPPRPPQAMPRSVLEDNRQPDNFWSEEDDPIFLPQTRQRRFDPFRDDPLLAGQSVGNQPGRAARMIEQIKRGEQVPYGPSRAQPPPAMPMPPAEPRVTKYTSYVNHGPIAQPPAQTYIAPGAPSGQQPTIMYYDPKTGAITGQASTGQAPQTQIIPQVQSNQPQVVQYGAPQPQVMQYGQPQVQYSQPQAQYSQPQAQYGQPQPQYGMPQQAQPMYIPGSIYTPDGGVHRLG